MKFSSSAHLEAEHPLYDLIFGIKQSPKLGLANNKMANNGLKRKSTVYNRIPIVYRPYTKESKENINVYQKKYHRIPSRIPKDKGDRIPIVYPVYCQLMPRNVQSTLFGLKLLMKIVIHKFFCLERKRLASAKYRTAACFFGFYWSCMTWSGLSAASTITPHMERSTRLFLQINSKVIKNNF